MSTVHVAVPSGVDPDEVRGLMAAIQTRAAVIQHVTDAVANQEAPLGPATAGQIALVDQAWRRIEQRYGALDSSGYAQLVGASATTRSVASKARIKGLVGYHRGRKVLFPRFQFDQHGLRPGWLDIVKPLREVGWSDDDIVLWLAAPHGALGRRSPVEMLDEGGEEGRSQLLAVIADEVAGLW